LKNKELLGKDVKFEDIKADIENQLKQQKLATEQQKWFAELKKNAKINYFKFAPSVNL
jgi:parvulin-like peptidyl-prolyl isomerase